MQTVLLFDIDGTLVRTGGAGKLAIESALVEEFSVALTATEIPYSGRTDRAISRDLLVGNGVDPSSANIDRLIAGYLTRLPSALIRQPGHVLPGVCELLDVVQQIGHFRVGLLTGNVRQGAQHKLQHYGLWEHFHFGGFGDTHENRNDVARAALMETEATMGPVDPACVWVIGDTPHDVQCARAIGAKVVAVATGWHPVDELQATGADVVLADLSDHAALLAHWHAG
ncbi:MAG: haloacid dehalogenase-like hydrolase [Bacteroidales bacterium]|nr:haloacid dehalogenase-like hydrolase [Bacteroidales bacterium]